MTLSDLTGISAVPLKLNHGTGWQIYLKHRYKYTLHVEQMHPLFNNKNPFTFFSERWPAPACDETALFLWYFQAEIRHNATGAHQRRGKQYQLHHALSQPDSGRTHGRPPVVHHIHYTLVLQFKLNICVCIFAEEASHEKGTFNVFCKYFFGFIGKIFFLPSLAFTAMLLFNPDLVTVTQFTAAGQNEKTGV